MVKHGERTICLICWGRGRVWLAPFKSIECLDCRGRGYVDHCVACAGQKRVWLGGDEYLDPCPGCEGSGMHRNPRIYSVVNGLIRVEPPPAGVLVATRNIAAELSATG